MPPVMATTLDFGRWRLCPDSHELHVDGQPRVLEPRTWALLLYLIEHRSRTVPLDELLDRFWHGMAVTDNVVARTVMKARKAIGEPAMIRTVHRVGYRFVGEPLVAPVAVPAQPAPASIRLGLLPFEDHSGLPGLEWAGQGLAQVVAQALERDRRLAVVPTATLAGAWEGLASDPGQAPEQRLARVLGLACLVRTRILHDAGRFHLDYTCFGMPGRTAQGRLSGSELTALGQQLAEAIEALLFPSVGVAVGFHSADAFFNQVLARALQACAGQRWQSAARLYQVALDEMPENLAVAAQQLAVLAALYDPAALTLGPALLERIQALGDDRLAAEVHQALGQAHLNLHGPSDAADHHMRAAQALAERHGLADWVLRVLLTRARYEHLKRDDDSALALYAQAARLCEASGNRLELARIINNQAVLAVMNGRLREALPAMEEAHRLALELRRDSSIAASGANLAMLYADLGLMRQARAQCERLRSRIGTLQDVRMAGTMVVTLCAIEVNFWSVAPIDALLGELAAHPDSGQPQLQPFLAVARAFRALAAGQPLVARGGVEAAIEQVQQQGDTRLVEQWLPVLLHCALRAGPGGDAAAVLQRLRAWPGHEDNPLQRGLVCWAQGLAEHRQGERGLALERLARAVRELPQGGWHAMASLDLAWLEIERGALLAARHALRDIAPWLAEHPAGWLVQARLHAAQGEGALALQLQRRLLEVLPSPWPAPCCALLAGYERLAAGSAVALPEMPVLPSCL